MPDVLGLASALAPLVPFVVPAPDAPRGLDPDDVSPGVEGFIATFAVVVVAVLLILSLVRRLRRLRHRAEVEAAQQPADAPGAVSADRPVRGGEHADQPDRAGERHLE